MSKSSSEIIRVCVSPAWPFVAYCDVAYVSGARRRYFINWPKTVWDFIDKYGVTIDENWKL